MIFRNLFAVVILTLFTSTAMAQNFDRRTNFYIQEALQTLGYDVGKVDGAWGRRTADAVRHYRYDFGLSDSRRLSVPEANTLLKFQNWFTTEPGLMISEPPNTNASYLNTSEAFSSPSLNQAPVILYGSHRHALAHLLQMTSAKFYKNTDGWNENRRSRYLEWMQNDIRRLDKDGWKLSSALVQTDLAFYQTEDTDKLRQTVIPIFSNLVEMVGQDSSTPANTQEYLTQRLFADMGTFIERLSCHFSEELLANEAKLAIMILEKFEKQQPDNLYALGGYRHELAKCTSVELARKLLEWRVDKAQAVGRPDLSAKAKAEWAAMEVAVGNRSRAVELYRQSFALASSSMDDEIYSDHNWNLVELGNLSIAEPLFMESVKRISNLRRSSTVAMNDTRMTAVQMMMLGFSFAQIDPLFTSIRRGDWLDTDNILEYYSIAAQTLLDTNENETAEAWARKLVERAENQNSLSSEEKFRWILVESLLRSGKHEDAEREIAVFKEKAVFFSEGAASTITSWLPRLRLSQRETMSPGAAYVDAWSNALNQICQTNTSVEIWKIIPGKFSREDVYSDPNFVSHASNKGLVDKFFACREVDWIVSNNSNPICFLLASEKKDKLVLDFVKSSLLKEIDENKEFGKGALGCATGVAFAERLEILEPLKPELAKMHKSIPAGLILLAIDNSTENVEHIGRNWISSGQTIFDTDYIGLELARIHNKSDRKRLREMGLGSYQMMHSGAAMDSREEANIRAAAFELSDGARALGLYEIALMYLDAGLHDVDDNISSSEAQSYLFNEEKAQFVLARAQLALSTEDPETAIKYSKPIVDAALGLAISGEMGSIEGLGQWSQRIAGFFEVYLSVHAQDRDLLMREPVEQIVAAQQFLQVAQSFATAGRLKVRLASADPDLVRSIQDTQREFRLILTQPAIDRKGVGDIREKLAELSKLQAKLEADDTVRGGAKSSSLLKLDEIRNLAKGSAKILLTSLSEHLLITTIFRGTETVRAIPLSKDDASRIISDYRSALFESPLAEANERGYQLFEMLFRDFDGGDWPQTIGIVIDGPFAALPFGALPFSITGVPEYLGAKSALAIAPSVGALEIGVDAQRNKNGERRPFLGFGDAEISPELADDLLGFIPAELRDTNPELRFMAATLGATPQRDVHTRIQATEARLWDMSENGELSEYSVIAIATHGYLGTEGKLNEPALLLAGSDTKGRKGDGLLTASEIYSLKLNARLVLLSACDTGSLTEGKKGLSELADAFIYAGARSLIVTHWPINSGAAVEMARRLALPLRTDEEITVAEAVRQSVVALLSDPNAERFHHPKYWASHAVIGLN